MAEYSGLTIRQLGAALQLVVAGPVPVQLEVSGETLVTLLAAAQAAFRERPKPEGCVRGGRETARKWRVA